MSSERDEVLAKVGKRVQIHDYGDETGGMSFSKDVPHGTMGTVIQWTVNAEDPVHEATPGQRRKKA